MNIEPGEGRKLFANDVGKYDSARPDYPPAIYETIVAMTSLEPDTKTLEIGGGSGLATRQLIRLGANPLLVVEPDIRFSPALDALESTGKLTIVYDSWENCEGLDSDFDLVAAASSYHWLDPESRLLKIANCLRVDGHVALWWNVFGDRGRPDPFHEATVDILSGLALSPSGASEGISFALDIASREAEFIDSGQFEAPDHHVVKWSLSLSSEQVGDLYGTFSSISRLELSERSRILDQLMEIAELRFDGKVERNMISIVYVAKRIV